MPKEKEPGEAGGFHKSGATAKTLVLLEDSGLLAVAKPPGCETVATDGGPALLDSVRGEMADPRIVPGHRLDRDTSGVQLLARGAKAGAELEGLFRNRLVKKEYLAVCLGVPPNRTGTINRNLSEWGGGRRPVRVVKGGGGLPARTGYEVLAEAPSAGSKGLSLIRFSPLQGRTHQIRVHASAFGHPILGDDQYGVRPENQWAKASFGLRRQALHAWRVRLPWNGREIAVMSPIPGDLADVIGNVFRDFKAE